MFFQFYHYFFFTEVKLRKGGTVEVSRPASLKKLRNENKTTKASPSPVKPSPLKATYRPMSMPIDNSLPVSHEDEAQSADENNSGEYILSSKGFVQVWKSWKVLEFQKIVFLVVPESPRILIQVLESP